MPDYSVDQELVQFGEGSLTLLEPRLDEAAGAADVTRAMLLTSCRKVALLAAIFAFLRFS
jgi:hypothetical protein